MIVDKDPLSLRIGECNNLYHSAMLLSIDIFIYLAQLKK